MTCLVVTAWALEPVPVGHAVPGTGNWEAWTSSPTDAADRLTPADLLTEAPTRTLDLSPEQSQQTWKGTGAALTDSAVGLLRANDEATELLFDPERGDGAHLNLVRLPLSATDFSTTAWTFGWNDVTQTLSAPSTAQDAADLVADHILPLRGDLDVVAAAWTAPPAMKDSGSLNGGSLLTSSLGAYGRLLIAQAGWLTAQGVPISAMSLGNEPFHSASGPGGYPTMLMSDAQMIALAKAVAPSLASNGIELWSVDHNWKHRTHYDTVQAGAPAAFSAAAFHCYGGAPGQMLGVSPPPIVTECTGTNDGFAGTFRWDAANLIVGSIDAGSTGLLMWNLALDQEHGPHTGGCSTCRGVVDLDTSTGEVSRTPEFFVLAHLARAADPGAAVIGSSNSPGLPYVAFRNPDGRLGIVGHNNTGASQVLAVALDGEPSGARFRVEPGELFTIRGWAPLTAGTVVLTDQTPVVGATIGAETAGWGTPSVSPTYQWLADGVEVAGATGSTFTPGPVQAGTRLAVRVSGGRPGYQPVTLTSLESAPVTTGSTPQPTVPVPSSPMPSSATPTIENLLPPALTGIAKVGRVLEATPGTWTVQTALLSYQWLRSDTPVPGATGPTYALQPADLGAVMSVQVTATAPGTNPAIAGASTPAPVDAGVIRVTSRGRVIGTLRAGSLLRARGLQTTPIAQVAYRWLRSGVPISRAGAKSSVYRLTRADIGRRISVRMIRKAPGYRNATHILRRSGRVQGRLGH